MLLDLKLFLFFFSVCISGMSLSVVILLQDSLNLHFVHLQVLADMFCKITLISLHICGILKEGKEM